MAEHPQLNQWKELAEKQMKGKSLDTLLWETPEGIPVKPLYTAEDLENLEPFLVARKPPEDQFAEEARKAAEEETE